MKTAFLKTINFTTMLVIKYLIFHDSVCVARGCQCAVYLILCLRFTLDRNA